MGLGDLLRRASRRAVAATVGAMDAQSRVEILDGMTAQAVSDVRIGSATLRFHAPSSLLRLRAAKILDKEPDTIAWLDSVSSGDVLWDVGANIGAFTIYAGAVRRCTVLAFEPSAANFHVLARNIQINALTDRVTAYCVALSGATGLGVLNLDSAEPGTAMSQFGRPGEGSRYSTRRQPLMHGMLGFTVDEFIARFGAPAPTHLKLDVDGLEWPILQGARATLSSERLRSAMIELSLTETAERDRAIALLGECGLRLSGQGESQGAAGEHAANHLFVR